MPISDRARLARSESAKKRWASGALKGYPKSEETRRKISESVSRSTKGVPKPAVSRALKGKKMPWITPEVVTRTIHSPEARAKAQETLLLNYRSRRRTSIELKVEGVLQALGIEYKAQFLIGVYTVDFLVESLLVIECDGEYWHNRIGVPERDARKDAWLREQGYFVARLVESDINRDVETAVLRVLHAYRGIGA